MNKKAKSFTNFSSQEKSSSYILDESVGQFLQDFKRLYNSGKKYSFKQWLGVFSSLIDEID